MALPYGIKETGLILSIIITIIICFGCYYCISLLLEIIEEKELTITKYSELGEIFFGSKGKYLVEFFIILMRIGFCVCYVLFFTYFLKNLACYYGDSQICERKLFALLLVALIIIPLSIFKKFGIFPIFCLIANILMIIVFIF